MPIAKGGMGQVWAARQSGSRGFQKLVAVKTIIATDEDSGNLEEMLFEEASLASQVRHPNVAQTLDLGEQAGMLYLVMEWVDGEPLDSIMRAARSVGGIPIAIAVHFIIQALKGLHAAHEAKNSKGEPLGIVHRDISPQNLLVTYSGVVKLVDFGVAKATHQTSQPTQLGTVKGKFAYMSPEQVHGQQIDARADVFAMGIVLYRITTGKHPFKSDSPAATIHNILTTGPARPSELMPTYPTALEQVVMKALARKKAERFASAHEMMLALEQALPATVTANAEKNAETFLRKLFDKRISERHKAMEMALKAAQVGPVSMPSIGAMFPQSQSTMRAVSVEPYGGMSAVESRDQEVVFSLPPARRRRPWSALALVACLVLAAGVFTLRQRRGLEARSDAPFEALPAAAAPAPTAVVAPAPPGAVDGRAGAIDTRTLPLASGEGSAGPVGSAIPSPTATSVAMPKKRDRAVRRDATPTPEPAAPTSAAPRPAPAIETGPAEGDPLNRRK